MKRKPKLEMRILSPRFPGFVFWSDAPFYNVLGNNNSPELMAHPAIVTLETK